MSHEVIMPKLGENMEEGTVNVWLKDEGDSVEKGEPILEISTDKANMEVEAEKAGFLGAILVEEEETVPVGETIAVIVETREEIGEVSSKIGTDVKKEEASPEEPASEKKRKSIKEKPELESPRIKASPAARSLAAEYDIELEKVPPGDGGEEIIAEDVEKFQADKPEITPLAEQKLTEHDVKVEDIPEKYFEEGELTAGAVEEYLSAAEVSEEAKEREYVSEQIEESKKKFTEVRKITAERMAESFSEVPHVTHTMQADMKEFIDLRNNINDKIDRHITYNDLLVFAVSRALRNFPDMNAHYKDDEIYLQKNINIGIAVDTDRGLVVPVIKKAGKKGLRDIAAERENLVEKSKEGNLKPDDYSGGTFTVSNLGGYDIESFTPIINQPEIGILGVGKILREPCVLDDEIVIRPVCRLSLSFDHRGIDGAPAAEFLQMLKNLIETPENLII